jgi:nucleoside-diphosphate-sugar epimerase
MSLYLVTGGAGFIGSHLVDKLISQSHQVIVTDNFSTGFADNRNKKAIYYHKSVETVEINPEATVSYDAIFHLAALPRIQPSFANPIDTYISNVTGTIKILELARHTNTKVIFASSSSVAYDRYANPYTFSKFIAEECCKSYNKIYGLPVAIARFFNVYGPRQIEHGPRSTAMGVFERQFKEKIPFTITGDGEQRRDFTHVNDIVDGLIKMSVENWNAEIFNLGSGKNYSLNELSKLFDHPVNYIPKRPGEALETLADISETQRLLNWKPTIFIEDYIKTIKKGA